MTYQEECRLRAQMLLDASDGVEFEYLNSSGLWEPCKYPRFVEHHGQYRRKTKLVRHERVVVWYQDGGGHVVVGIYMPTATPFMPPAYTELKRETVFVEVEE